MLSPELAKERLKEWRIEKEEEHGVGSAKALPEQLRAIALGLLSRDASGKAWEGTDWQQRHQTRNLAVAPLDTIPAQERLQIFSVFFGELSPAIENAWQVLKRFPYQHGYQRKSFRAPGDALASFQQRLSWLDDMIRIAARWKADVLTPTWLAAWAPHIEGQYGHNQTTIGRLLATVIDEGGKTADEVFDILCQSLLNEHEIGAMGRHVVRGLLMASRPEGWDLVEKTLLAAQRQEGLRQVVLETVDEAHPEAYIRMLRLIRDNDLARFSAVARAANVWFGLSWDSVSVKVINDTFDRAISFLTDDAARAQVLVGKNPEDAFLALWSIAFYDALAAIPCAADMLKDERDEFRFVATLHLCQLALPQAEPARAAALDDADLRVAWCAANGAPWQKGDTNSRVQDVLCLFERFERLFHRLPEKPVELKPMVWPWTNFKVSRETVAQLMTVQLGDRPPTVLVPYLPAMSKWVRRNCIQWLAGQQKWDSLTRETLVRLAGDASSDVRAAVYPVLAKVKLQHDEILTLEGYLTRKSNDVRQGILPLLLSLPDNEALASSERLLSTRDAQQRLAGLEILRQMSAKDRNRDQCRNRAEGYRSARRKLTAEEQLQLDGILESASGAAELDRSLGLFDAAQRSPGLAPKDCDAVFVTDAAIACLKSLDDLIHEHRETPIKIKTWRGEEKEELLGNLRWGFPVPYSKRPGVNPSGDLPLRGVWEKWHEDRPAELRDGDGFEIARAVVWLGLTQQDHAWKSTEAWANASDECKPLLARLIGGKSWVPLKYPSQTLSLLIWLSVLFPPKGEFDFLADAVESVFSLVPQTEMAKLSLPGKKNRYGQVTVEDWRHQSLFQHWFSALDTRAEHTSALTTDQIERLWQLSRWRDEPFPGARRMRPEISVLIRAYRIGKVTLADIGDHLLGRVEPSYRTQYPSLAAFTERKLNADHGEFLATHPEVRDLVESCRARIVETELARGETPTPATAPARGIESLWGSELLLKLLRGLGKQGFKMAARWSNQGGESKPATLTYLISVTYPSASDTPEQFACLARKAMKEGWLTEKLLLELVFLAPQWVKHVAATLGWDGFDEALYWFLAHMRWVSSTENAAVGAGVEADAAPSEDGAAEGGNQGKTSAWQRLIAERTPLSDADRMAGAVDVGWFRRIYAGISPKRWQAMAAAARFAANAAQARHAQFVAEVLTGKASRRQLIDGIRKKQLKDYVRLLGLYPLAAAAKREKDLIERYNVLQGYRRYARDLSSMSKPEAMRSLDVGMQNLASTAGYADPLRLEWAMEAQRVQKLAEGPLSATKEGVKVTLALDEEARPQITVEKGGKPLKTVPPAVKKDKKVAELFAQATELKRQASLTRSSLEAAMCRGDTFTAAELQQLCGHPILAPQLNRLVLVGEGILGYPDKLGKALRDADGKLEPVKKDEQLRLAHPHDLLESKSWSAYQQECFRSERVQPFKQVFRELYVVTKQERRDGTFSNRYATQQIQPKQAMALWGQRGWHTQEGVEKTFYDVGLTVSVNFKYGAFTPLEVEGLTIDTIEFRRRDDYKPMKLTDVPPRIFSEAMRDIDLVVSVAHRGGVDPEASASTVEMRAALLRETCSLLGLKNVRIKEMHAVIDGQLANYSVHLGSATVHRTPGGSICLVAVPAQHRGRIFLPFADDDPRTAEVLSKVILLARDAEIQDPTVLEQIRA
jgi:hypothetical protein